MLKRFASSSRWPKRNVFLMLCVYFDYPGIIIPMGCSMLHIVLEAISYDVNDHRICGRE
jgi:hypothetical protein